MSRLPNAAVLFSILMMVAVCIRKAVMSTARARSAELWAMNRATRSPLAVLLDEQHEIHYQVPRRGVDYLYDDSSSSGMRTIFVAPLCSKGI